MKQNNQKQQEKFVIPATDGDMMKQSAGDNVNFAKAGVISNLNVLQPFPSSPPTCKEEKLLKPRPKLIRKPKLDPKSEKLRKELKQML